MAAFTLRFNTPKCSEGDYAPGEGWWSRQDSNLRPSHCERDALPTELRPQPIHFQELTRTLSQPQKLLSPLNTLAMTTPRKSTRQFLAKIHNVACLYRHAVNARYYAVKKVGRKREEASNLTPCSRPHSPLFRAAPSEVGTLPAACSARCLALPISKTPAWSAAHRAMACRKGRNKLHSQSSPRIARADRNWAV